MINIFSEIGKLKEVILYRPNKELENIIPECLKNLLFDDIPYLKIAQDEHDQFANIFKKKDISILYLEDLVVDALSSDSAIKEQFIKDFIKETKLKDPYLLNNINDFLKEKNERDLIQICIYGLKKTDLEIKVKSLSSMINNDYPFIFDPLPNTMFTRDTFSCIGEGVSINKMHHLTRQRESIFGEYIFKYHPKYKTNNIYYNREEISSLEGGDIIILNKSTIAIGISERTEPSAIEKFAENIFKISLNFKKIIAFEIPSKRAFMHLDTVFTQLDIDKFIIHQEVKEVMNIYNITKNNKGYTINKNENSLQKILSDICNKDVKLIVCGGNNKIASKREQWNDASNTLAIAPGEVIAYNRNIITNKLLIDSGILVNEIPSSELSRGRGGPRCMSMPIVREEI